MGNQEFGFGCGRVLSVQSICKWRLWEGFLEVIPSHLRLKNILVVVYDEFESILYTLK